jgi:cell wall-associated NlpC family hydrolase
LAAATLLSAVALTAPAASATDAAISATSDTVEPSINQLAGEALAALGQYEASLDRATLQAYVELRGEVARRSAYTLGYSATDVVVAWSNADFDHQRAVLNALTQLGVPYRSMASVPGEGFDCSGLTSFAWRSAGTELFRSSGDQIRHAATRTRDDAVAGDLVYYPGHVMMYLGVGDAIVHAITHGRDVELDTISPRRTSSVRFGDPTT